MKRLHLICNAHLDPIWQWEWEEGAAAALSTFQSAANLAEKYDYIFCHNEVNLYKYTEKYAPALFAQIQKLVKQGKWHIMGGWYLQPDCLMPSGEGMLRQIREGELYFKENSELCRRRQSISTRSDILADLCKFSKMRSGQLYVYASLRKIYAVSAT